MAITGSAGKTTTKEMTAALLATRGPVLKTEGNLNNQYGLPLTLLRLRPEHRPPCWSWACRPRASCASSPASRGPTWP